MPLAIAKGPFAGRALAVALMLALVGAVAPAAAQSASAPASATSTPPSPTRFVTDGAGFLSAPAQDEFEQRLARYERDTGHQVLLWIGQTTGGEPVEPWAVRAFTPNSLDRAAIQTRMVSPVCPRVHVRHSRWKTVREWRELGVIPQGAIADDTMASLFEPDGPSAPSYLLTHNYRVILEYNCSNYYAMSVGLLADEIGR